MIRIRDPIHGSIPVSEDELPVVDSRVFQRLRGIKQLGYTDQAFPGATHTRYAHSIGAMEVATRMFDALFPADAGRLPGPERARFRQCLRLAVLLHDVGHPPASHASEPCMPLRGSLGLDRFSPAEQASRASHEDYTHALIVRSELTPLLIRALDRVGATPEDVAHLITGLYPERTATFRASGVDFFPLLTQIVSGEMDADRMDYLQRDSFFAGVSYGKFDQSWLVENLAWHAVDDRAYMALSHRAVFAFEDFLLSRYHMFVSVYYHYIPVGFDTMLLRFFQEAPGEFSLSSDLDAYVAMDDIALMGVMRLSENRWAQRIANRQAFRRLIEINADGSSADFDAITSALTEANVEHFVSRDHGVLSKYYGMDAPGSLPIYVRNEPLRQAMPIDSYSRIYERYQQPTPLSRVYVHPDQQVRGREVLARVVQGR
jgi:HD superfamily phosphohydrolase